MALQSDSFRRRMRLAAGGRAGQNSGTCISCGKDVRWRSVNHRCRTCEMDDVKARPPMYIDRDVLMNAGSEKKAG